ncbi:hypothetical protein [Stenotrophomonas maltophilia]|uniref:hypothetical protein n=1 Tax=Stenotrophomonas maltophilia TaxID=40324 RepID=UPI0015DEDB18|nr:hypothetical protein [Stenotrophomonas maltophilia]MBA0446142.1 hypothetical protein [Stenotrophomonas maltophilia]
MRDISKRPKAPILTEVKRRLSVCLPLALVRILNEEQNRVEIAVKDALKQLDSNRRLESVQLDSSERFAVKQEPIVITKEGEDRYLVRDACSVYADKTRVSCVEDIVLYLMFSKLRLYAPDLAADIRMFERKRLTKQEYTVLEKRQRQLETELRYIRQRLA